MRRSLLLIFILLHTTSTIYSQIDKQYYDDFGRVITKQDYKNPDRPNSQLKLNDSTFVLINTNVTGILVEEAKEKVVDFLNQQVPIKLSNTDTLLIVVGTKRSNVRNLDKGSYDNYMKILLNKPQLRYVEMIDVAPLKKEDKEKYRGQIIDSQTIIRNTFFPYYARSTKRNRTFYGGCIFLFPDGSFIRLGGDSHSDVKVFLSRI